MKLRFYHKTIFTTFFACVLLLMFSSQAQAAITYRSSATNGNGTASTSVTVNAPTGVQQFDVLVASVTYGGSGVTWTPPTGWVQIAASTCSNAQATLANITMFYKLATASEPASYTWTPSTSVAYSIAVSAYTGVNNSSPYDIASCQTNGTSGATTTSYTAPSITTSVNDEMIITAHGTYRNATPPDTFTPPAGMTEKTDYGISTSGRGLETNEVFQGTAGATGTQTATVSTASYGASAIVGLKPNVVTGASGGYSYNYFYASGTINNGSGSGYQYGAKYGTSPATCQSLPSDTGPGNGPLSASSSDQGVNVYISANASTTYYYCIYAWYSPTGTYYYPSTAQSVTTSAIPAPAVAYPLTSTIDDVSADIGIGVISYVTPVTVTARWGTSNVACASLPNSSTTTSPGTDVNNYMAFTKRITGLSPSTTYYWCFSAATAQGTSYSSVTSFATTAAGGTGCDLLPSSSLASAADKTTLAGYLGTSRMQGTLLYKGTTNGWASSTFHTNANAQGATMTLIQNSANSKVFGGYNPQAWDSASGYKYAPNAFLFSLSDGYQLKQKTANYQSYNNTNYGPTFGSGHDIAFPNATLNSAGSVEYTNGGSTYETPSSKGAFTYLHGGTTNQYFTPSEIEVYKISVCTISAPTVTTPTSASITATSATLGGNVTSGGTAAITARGICYAPTATDADPRIGDPGVTCTPEGATTTGVFTVAVSNLQGNTAYSYNAYATNSVDTNYILGTFNTLNPSPTSVATLTNDPPRSYYVNLKGSANPNGYPSYGHFRIFPSAPASCAATADAGGIRYPEGSGNFPDINLGSESSPVNFNYQIPFNASTWLYPNTTYYYCAYAVNTVSSVNYTTGATSGGTSGVITFTTDDGASGPCDAPSAGNMTIPAGAICNFAGTIGGVDSGTGTKNTAQLTIPAGTRLSVSAGQKIAYGSISLSRGAILSIARGGSLAGGGIFVHDNDRDTYLDDATQYVGSTASAATEFIRRNTISTVFNYSWKIASGGATYDCNKNTAYAYRVLPNLVRDADNDGYKTSTAAGPQCVGAAGVFNGRTYYNDGSGPN